MLNALEFPFALLMIWCVYVCLYSSTLKAETYLRGTDQRCSVVSIIPGASAKFLHLQF